MKRNKGFWSFIRDMMVFDWLFGRRKKESFWEQRQRESRRFTNNSQRDDYVGDAHSYDSSDYDFHDFDELQDVDYYHQDFDNDFDYHQDFDDDLDSSMLGL